MDQLSFAVELLRVEENPETRMWILYGIITVLSIIAYKLGFAIKLPLLKSIIVYIFLILGSTILTFLAIFLPITEALVLTVVVLSIYHIRRRWTSKEET